MYQIAWLNARPYCWAASIDGGKTWENLEAADDENEIAAMNEASEKYGVAYSKWSVLEDSINSLNT